LGLGIDRRLNAERGRQGQRRLQENEVSFWYIANKLSERFRRVAEHRLGRLEACSAGVWRATVLGYSCLLVSTVDLPVDEDSFPLHVLGIALLIVYAPRYPVLTGLGWSAYLFGLRHAFDADHISAIDNTTRKLMQEGERPLGVGFFFLLGHSTIVLGLALGIAAGSRTLGSGLPALRE